MNRYKSARAKCLFALFAMISVVIIGTVANVQALQPMTLTVQGADGSQVVLSEVGIGNLASYRAYGGRRNQAGNPSGKGNYTGVPIITFLNLVGGFGILNNVTIYAPDGYNATFTYLQLNGDLNTYDNTSAAPVPLVPHYGTLVPMLAYYYNDADLSSGGPLRGAIVGPEGLLTDSSFWVQNVVRIEVTGPIPNNGQVGGEWAPISTVQLVSPWIALALLAIATAGAASHRLLKKRW